MFVRIKSASSTMFVWVVKPLDYDALEAEVVDPVMVT